MDHRLLTYYNRELQYLRELGGEFARQFPKVAGRLGLESFECSDPYVERLLEGFAFLAARVQLKIDAEFPQFTEHLLSLTYPHYLAPTPSMMVVKLLPKYQQAALKDGFEIARGTALRSATNRGELTACEYRTAHQVTLWPVELASVSHTAYVGDFGELDLPGKRRIRGALRFRFRTVAGTAMRELSMDELVLFLSGPEQVAMRLYELLLGGGQAIAAGPAAGSDPTLALERPVRPVGFEDEEALLPFGPKSFQGYRLLHEYFAFPQRYQFIKLAGLRPAVARCESSELEVTVLLDRYDPMLEASVTTEHFELSCTPAVNLFPKRLDRVHLTDRAQQFHVVADRTRPLDYEIHSLLEVTGIGTRAEARREFRPLYSCRERTVQERSHYTVHREARVKSSRERRVGPRSSYAGSELFISLVDGDTGPVSSDLKQLSLSGLCTNRDLPLTMSLGVGRTDFTVDTGAPVEAIRCLAGPSEPRPPVAWGATAWHLVSHLTLNHLSITDSSAEEGAVGLRQLLHLYSDFGETALRRQVEGLRSVASVPIVRRVPANGPLAFGRGIQVTLECDEAAFEGGSAFLFASVLERFFAKYAAINSFTETVLRSVQRGELMRWPARIGGRAIG